MLNCRKLIKLQDFSRLINQQGHLILKRNMYNKAIIGNREVVGFGMNGSYIYFDKCMFPFPSIRWMENTPEIMALREKEKGILINICLFYFDSS